MSWIAKARASAAELGWFNALLYAADRTLQRAGTRGRVICYELVAQPVPAAPLLAGARGRSIAVRPIVAGDAALGQMPLTQAVVDYRFRQDAICLGAFKDGAMIGCLWLCLGGYDEDELRCRFVPEPAAETAWDFDVYLHPEHRVGLGFARLWDEANGLLRGRGVRWSMSRISAVNPASRAAHTRLGARRLGRLVALRWGTWQLALSKLPPRIHFSRGRGAPPAYRLRAPL